MTDGIHFSSVKRNWLQIKKTNVLLTNKATGGSCGCIACVYMASTSKIKLKVKSMGPAFLAVTELKHLDC